MSYLLAIDLETTGLSPTYNEITQVGAVVLDKKFEQVASFESLVKINYPERGITEEFNAFEFSGIEPENLEAARDLKTVLTKLKKFTNMNTPKTKLHHVMLFGQNIQFDMRFLLEGFKQIGEDWPFDYHSLDLVAMFAQYHLAKFGELPEKYGLDYILDFFGAEKGNRHNAMADIRMTIAMAKHINNELKQ